jgi:dTDP-4-dehydrorhamnose 3,5-epimerase
MFCRPTAVSGVFEFTSVTQRDSRGYFRRGWCRDVFAQVGLEFSPVQQSLSNNIAQWTLRGLHYQLPPFEEQKLVRCVSGCVFDVAVDLRANSATRGRWHAVELSADEGNALFIPRGCAHGFLTMCDEALVEYLIDMPYAPEHARAIRWNDEQLAIAWPAIPRVISERDRDAPGWCRD